MRKVLTIVLRAVLALTVALGTALTAGFLISVLKDARRRPLFETASYVLLYGVAVIVQLFMEWSIWQPKRWSSPVYIAAYAIWLTCFIWHGWFTEWAPFRLHEILMPDLDAEAYRRMYITAASWILCYALFPILGFTEGRKTR
jgi:hypothetical protein